MKSERVAWISYATIPCTRRSAQSHSTQITQFLQMRLLIGFARFGYIFNLLAIMKCIFFIRHIISIKELIGSELDAIDTIKHRKHTTRAPKPAVHLSRA